MIIATITYNDGTVERRGMKDFQSLCAWMANNFGRYSEIVARDIGEGKKDA